MLIMSYLVLCTLMAKALLKKLKYLTDENIIVIPKSTHQRRMIENIAISDISLSNEQRVQIQALDGAKPLIADFNDPELAKFLLNYEKKFKAKA